MAETDPVDLPDGFERLLRQELSVEPSPALAARIRADVRGVRPPALWTTWLLPLAGAAAVAVGAVAWTPLFDRSPATLPPPGSPVVTAGSAQARVEPRTTEPPDRIVRPRPARARPARQAAAATSASSAVVVDQNQRAALTTLVSMIDQGRLTADAFAKTTPQSTEPIADQVVPITIAPVPVSAISPGGVLQNDTQRK